MTTTPTPPIIPPEDPEGDAANPGGTSSAEADRLASYGERPEETLETAEDSESSLEADRQASTSDD